MSTPWWRLTVHCTPDTVEAVGAFLVVATGQGVEEIGGSEVRSMAESETEARALLQQVLRRFPGATGEVVALDPIDWTVHWRDGIQTRRFGRLVVTPSWLPVQAAGNEVVLTLDPESAFGNGEHGSTRVAMSLLEAQLRAGDHLLDFGSGSGILAIAGVMLGAASAIGIEVDADALPIAEANAARNGVASRVSFLVGDAGELGPLAGPARVICSNILRSVNTLLLPAIRASLLPGGVVIFSGMEAAEAELFRPFLVEQGWRVVEERLDAGWWGVAAAIA